jgi:hypothetical protein
MSHAPQIDQLLSGYPEHVRNTAAAARQFLKRALPNIDEKLDRPGLRALLDAALAAWKARNA